MLKAKHKKSYPCFVITACVLKKTPLFGYFLCLSDVNINFNIKEEVSAVCGFFLGLVFLNNIVAIRTLTLKPNSVL